MTSYYEIDLDHISFAEWLVKLDKCAAKAGYTGSQLFTQMTGILCWYSFYEEGLTTETALEAFAVESRKFAELYEF